MSFDFDKIIERKNTNSLKYDFAKHRGMPEDVLPLWVADMDFQAPKEVIDVLVEKSQHGIFGYSQSDESYDKVLEKWFLRRFDWQIERKWLVKTPGVVFAVTTAIHAYTNEGDGILIQEPVYYPFKKSIEVNKRKTVVNQLILSGEQYVVDYEDFERKIVENNVKLFIFCSPHNPVGRVWTKEELIKMGDICIRHGVFIVSDEIHADFVYEGYKHHVFSELQPTYRDHCIICTAPSKTFNLAGLQISNIFIPNKEKRHAFIESIKRTGYDEPSIMGVISCQAAYEHGEAWLEALKAYLAENLKYAMAFFKEEIPEARIIKPEGTYLLWVDFSKVSHLNEMNDKELDGFMARKAKVWLDGGTMFGAGGEGYQRFNIACPRKVLEKALKQIAIALKNA